MCSSLAHCRFSCIFFFFNDTATTEIYTLSLHDALPIYEKYLEDAAGARDRDGRPALRPGGRDPEDTGVPRDRKSTRLNSSHLVISYAVFCLKKKKVKIGHVSSGYRTAQCPRTATAPLDY